jgi:hypothetical protein
MPEQAESWVVYLMTIHQKADGMRAVCQQHEWEAIERARPGYHKLIQAGIQSEHDAELLARGTSGDARPRVSKAR